MESPHWSVMVQKLQERKRVNNAILKMKLDLMKTQVSTCTLCRMSWVRVPPEVAYFSLKMTILGELQCVALPLESLSLRDIVFCSERGEEGGRVIWGVKEMVEKRPTH